MINVNLSAIEGIINENATFDYVASNGEIAHQYWSQHMTPQERLNLVDVAGHKGTTLKTLRSCLKIIEESL